MGIGIWLLCNKQHNIDFTIDALAPPPLYYEGKKNVKKWIEGRLPSSHFQVFAGIVFDPK